MCNGRQVQIHNRTTPGPTRGMPIEAMLSYRPIAARVAKITNTGELSAAEESITFSYTDSKNANLYSHFRKGFSSFFTNSIYFTYDQAIIYLHIYWKEILLFKQNLTYAYP